MKLKYVGLKDEETAFSPETGITWTPGSSHDVADLIAKRMLAHPDVFALDESKGKAAAATAPVAAPAPAAPPAGSEGDPVAPEFVIATSEGPLVLDAMDRDTLVALAKEAGLKHHHNAGIDKLRALLMAAFPLKAD